MMLSLEKLSAAILNSLVLPFEHAGAILVKVVEGRSDPAAV